jgi:hypothetical protein
MATCQTALAWRDSVATFPPFSGRAREGDVPSLCLSSISTCAGDNIAMCEVCVWYMYMDRVYTYIYIHTSIHVYMYTCFAHLCGRQHGNVRVFGHLRPQLHLLAAAS